MSFGPGHEHARAGAAELYEGGLTEPQEAAEQDSAGPRGRAGRPGGHDQQGQASGADHEVAFAAIDVLPWAVTAGG